MSARFHETKNGTYKHIGNNGTLSQVRLSQVVKHRTWPTPKANDAEKRGNFALGQQTPPMRLNPAWVEWLMGWPIAHTELKPLETDKFREWLQQHGDYSAVPESSTEHP